VTVLVYVPAYAFARMVTRTVGVTVKSPIPVSAAALKNFTAVGADAPAGTPSGYETEFVAFVQVPCAQLAVMAVIAEVFVGRVCGDPPPVEKWVDVMVRFQPVPDPVSSFALRPIV